MAAIIKGIDYCLSHSSEDIAEAIAPHFATTDKQLIVKAIESYVKIDAWAKTPYMTEASFDRLQNVLIRAGTVKEKVAYNDVVDNSIIEEILKK